MTKKFCRMIDNYELCKAIKTDINNQDEVSHMYQYVDDSLQLNS